MTTGPARLFTLVFGIAYIAVALLEVALGLGGNTVDLGVMMLMYSFQHNLIHWATGLVLLGAVYAGRYPAKMACRAVGFVFLAVTLLGLLAPAFTGTLLGHGGDMPWVYHVIHGATAAFGLLAGYTSHAEPGMTRKQRHGRAI